MCVDFRDLNKDSIKDNYPLPSMDFLLQKVTGSAFVGPKVYTWLLKGIARPPQV
jgi:hypothetical protein